MKPVESNPEATISYAAVLEKIEILRSTLRWAQNLDRAQINKLLNQCTALRDEVVRLSHTERFVKASAATPRNQSVAQRRHALLERDFQFEGVFGDSPRLIEALEIAEKAARTDLPVLIDGESGTGKELMAKVIHANGNRADRPYITLNCGAIPENLLESELFGHKRGAFTGASADRAGKFEAANGGTIFLDEIGELPLIGQVKLLRVLQSNEIQRVGSDQVINVDARIVAATNKNLLEMCKAGAFREDLYYRLSIVQVTLPPLRDRRDEIPLLIEYLANEASQRLQRQTVRLSRRLSSFLGAYDYPGNIRELRNIIFRISCLAADTADLEHLPENVRLKMPERAAQPEPEAATSLNDAKRRASDEAERSYLLECLEKANFNVTNLAQSIGMNRSHVQTLLKKHGLSARRANKARTDGASSSAASSSLT
ncbi:sigma-54 interaction domain-containing protein [Steroidobacter sp.]|uniref:sigma-54 interaction domain-containing protein n=1 Tax=Steroidobacter sp. TaxID=1978227 RepID=UPI001A402B5A|nr:sigma 54-interacting transcriptional regulator [Steroidobacter sp.]MBL8265423.1 sigma 54-interacting transcriptional regulator [Steroidobacter sp.]